MEFSAVNTIWVLVGAALVFFMQAGFAMVEAGFTRAKNAGNIIMKNLMDFCIGTPDLLARRLRHHVRRGKPRSLVGRSRSLLSRGTAYDSVTAFLLLGDPHLPDRILCDSRDHRFRFHGRAHQIHCLLYLHAMIICWSSTRFPVTGSGAAAGSQSLASMISPDPRPYIWSAASPPASAH